MTTALIPTALTPPDDTKFLSSTGDWAVPAGEPSTGALLFTATILTAADVLALGVTPVVLVPAPDDVNLMLQIVSVSVYLRFVTTPYTVPLATNILIGTNTENFVSLGAGVFLGSGADVADMSPAANLFAVATHLVNKAIQISTDNSVTDGDSKLSITVYYVVNDVSFPA